MQIKHRFTLFVFVIMVLVTSPLGANSLTAQQAEAKNEMMTILQDAIDTGIPGISVAVANSNGVAWTATVGHADIAGDVPVTTDMLFGLGSITKTFVAVVIMQLAEEGKLDLTKTPKSFLGDQVANVANADKAQLMHLLNHTSGIPSWEDDPHWIRQGRGENIDPNHIWGKTETLAYIADTPALFEPGTNFSYSNTNHTILGMVIESVTGKDAVTVIRERIQSRIAANDIYFEGFETLPQERLAKRYHHATETFKKQAGVSAMFPEVRPGLIDVSTSNLSVEWTAGGMVGTAHDLARYALALRNGELLKPESMELLLDWYQINQTQRVGHGVFRYESPGGIMIGHGGDVLGYTANMHWLEDSDAIVVILTNVGTMHTGPGNPNAYQIGRESLFFEAASRFLRAKRTSLTKP